VTTLSVMKARIATELRRTDLTSEIASAISSAISAYKYDRFSFNSSSFIDEPASDGETSNAWMTTAERLVRARAKGELYIHVIKEPVRAKEQFDMVGEALQQLTRNRSHVGVTATANTRGAMKLRIGQEVERSDLTDADLENAINAAITSYDRDRFYFNESRAYTFDTVASQDIYTEADQEAIGRLVKVDYLFVLIGDNPVRLVYRDPESVEWTNMATTISEGQPGWYTLYNESIRLYPIPSDVFTVRLAGVFRPAAPATDVETLNPWMMVSKAERMIRQRAKAFLYTDLEVMADDKKAQKYLTLAEEARHLLMQHTADLTGAEGGYVEPDWA